MSLSRGAWEAVLRDDGAEDDEVSEEAWLRYALSEEHKRAQRLASNVERLRQTIRRLERERQGSRVPGEWVEPGS